MRQTMEEQTGAYGPVRATVQAKVDDLGGAGVTLDSDQEPAASQPGT